MLTVDYDRFDLRAGDLLLDLGCGFGWGSGTMNWEPA